MNSVAAGPEAASVLPTKIRRPVAGAGLAWSRCAALHSGAPTTSAWRAFRRIGSASTSPLQVLVSKLAEYESESRVRRLPVFRLPRATWRMRLGGLLKIPSRALNRPRAGAALALSTKWLLLASPGSSAFCQTALSSLPFWSLNGLPQVLWGWRPERSGAVAKPPYLAAMNKWFLVGRLGGSFLLPLKLVMKTKGFPRSPGRCLPGHAVQPAPRISCVRAPYAVPMIWLCSGQAGKLRFGVFGLAMSRVLPWPST